MKALVGAFNKEKALVGAFSVIVKTGCGTDGSICGTNEIITRLHYSDSHIRDQLKFNAHLNHNCLCKGERSGHLHDELPPPGHAPLRYECVDRLLLLLGLLDLDQPRDGVDGRTLLKGKGVNVNE